MTPSNSAEMERAYIERIANIVRDQMALGDDLKELQKEIKGAGFKYRPLKKAARVYLSDNPQEAAAEVRVEIAEELRAIDVVAPEQPGAA